MWINKEYLKNKLIIVIVNSNGINNEFWESKEFLEMIASDKLEYFKNALKSGI